jgi:CRISPR-associated protein Cst2
MAFVTGLLLIDAPASALNNLGSIPGERTDNTVGVKLIKAKDGTYPYVAAQAFRYWYRTTLERRGTWRASPIYREEKIAYTDANPLLFWDDDLFGYMRAPSQSASAKARREADPSRTGETKTTDTITRVSPFRVSTLVSLGPVKTTSDFGTMSRHEGDPVIYEHQFYRTTLRGLFSLDLHACGTFSYRNKTGFRNLDSIREALARDMPGIEHLEEEKAYRLPLADRITRLRTLFEGLAHLEGGAKQTLHYTDVSPALLIATVTKGGNHLFGHVIGIDEHGLPQVKTKALEEALTVFADDLLSPVYVGWVQGYLDKARAPFETWASDYTARTQVPIQISHPREALLALATAFEEPGNAQRWLA